MDQTDIKYTVWTATLHALAHLDDARRGAVRDGCAAQEQHRDQQARCDQHCGQRAAAHDPRQVCRVEGGLVSRVRPGTAWYSLSARVPLGGEGGELLRAMSSCSQSHGHLTLVLALLGAANRNPESIMVRDSNFFGRLLLPKR